MNHENSNKDKKQKKVKDNIKSDLINEISIEALSIKDDQDIIETLNIETLNINEQGIIEPVKRKKGRPRKDISQIPIVEKAPEEKKKRGRKKKEGVVEEVKQKKKRGRKAAVKYFSSSIRKKIPLTTVIQDNNNFILHLDVKDDNLENTSNNINIDTLSLNDNYKQLNSEIPNESENDVKSKILNLVFNQLKEENKEIAEELQKEYDELIENDDSILSDFIAQEEDDKKDLRELYEKRIEFREHQDTILIDKLENIHKDKDIFDKITFSNETCNTTSENETRDNQTKLQLHKQRIQDNNRKKGFFELMSDFIYNDKWLENTDISCWWCCHTFDTVPLGLPIEYNKMKQKFQVKGVFCSFSCMVAYKNELKNYNKDYLLKYLYNKLTGSLLSDSKITPAPPRCSLKMFGGELDINEFRSSFNENKVYKMIEYPMCVCKDYIEEVDIQNVKRVNQSVFKESLYTNKPQNLDERRIEDARNRLSQIEKTTITLGNTIDKFIKIT